jgi:periplasmic copper chaperone A
MSLRSHFATFCVALALCAPLTATAASPIEIGSLTISSAWTRATPPRAPTAGGFVTIENSGEASDRLIGATSPIAGRAELHAMSMRDGTMIMQQVKNGIEIPPGGTVTLAPGGLHIMFMKLSESLVEGGTVSVILSFENAGDIEILFPVQAMGARQPVESHQNGSHEHGSMQ